MASERQKKTLQKVLENGGNVSKAMRESGYSPAMAKNPQKFTQSQAFQQYMHEAGVTDQKLVETIKQGLDATKAVVMGQGSGESFVDIQPDHPTRHKFLETSLKIRGIGRDEGSNTYNFTQIIQDKNDKYAG